MQRILGAACALTTLVAATGCGTVLSTMQPAQTTPGQHVRGEIGLGVGVPVGQISDTIQAAEDIAEGAGTTGTINPDAVDDFLSGIFGLLLNPPSVASEFQARYGFSDIVDVGLRLATSGNVRADIRYRVIQPERPDGLYGSTGVGFTYASTSFTFPDPIDDFIEMDSITRFEVDVPMLFGWSNEIYHLWFGPKLVFSTITTGLSFRDEGSDDPAPETISANGINFYYVAQIGGAIGYKHVWIALELTIGGVAGAGDIERNDADMTKYEPTYGGLMVYPAVGLLLEF
jgi:hypothetical protein